MFSDGSQSWMYARDLMFAIRATFEDFAPHYYSSIGIRFCDPINFSNEFLANATHACLYNIRYVSCILNTKLHGFKLIKKTSEMLAVWGELRHLLRFELVYIVAGETLKPYPSQPVGCDDNIWTIIDDAHDKAFSKFERRALATTLKGFKAVRSIRLETPGTHSPDRVWVHYDVDHLSVTFTKDSS